MKTAKIEPEKFIPEVELLERWRINRGVLTTLTKAAKNTALIAMHYNP